MTAPVSGAAHTIATAMSLVALVLDEKTSRFDQALALVPKSEWPLLIQVLARTGAGYARVIGESQGFDSTEMADIVHSVRSSFLLHTNTPEDQP